MLQSLASAANARPLCRLLKLQDVHPDATTTPNYLNSVMTRHSKTRDQKNVHGGKSVDGSLACAEATESQAQLSPEKHIVLTNTAEDKSRAHRSQR